MSALHELLSRDHARLDQLLTAALRPDGSIDAESYRTFRSGLLWHIAVEERVLLPAVRKHRTDSEVEKQLHRDHAALAALLVPPPSAAEIYAIRTILEAHNPLEEGAGGFYDGVEELLGDELPAILLHIHEFPQVRLAPHADTEVTRRSIAQLVRDAEAGRRQHR
ncbi:MAG TPA: hemerythrin domain-containing protein [Thermoanaerobaculia bacterium]